MLIPTAVLCNSYSLHRFFYSAKHFGVEVTNFRNTAMKVEVGLIICPLGQCGVDSHTTANNVCAEGLIMSSADLTYSDLSFPHLS